MMKRLGCLLLALALAGSLSGCGSSGPAEGQTFAMDTVMNLNREKGMTVVLITHYMDEAIEADRIFVMNDGKITASGAPKDVFLNYDKVKAAGLELPVASKVSKALIEAGYDLPFAITDEELAKSICRLKQKI